MAILPGVVASSPGYLLDGITGAYGAYSLRQLSGSVTNVCQCIRDSDSATQDFTAAELTDGTLANFGSGTHARVKTLYDQSGGGNHATQTYLYSCPTVVLSGTEQVDATGLPWMNFDGTNDFIPLQDALPNIDIGNLSSFVVGKFDNTAGLGSGEYMFTLGTPYADSGTGTTIHKRWYAPAALNPAKFNWGYGNDYDHHQESMDTNQHLFTTIAGTTQGNWQPFVDGTSQTSKTLQTGDSGYIYGLGGINNNNAYALNGKIQEAIIFDSDQSANRTAIESNIMGYYNL